MQDASSAIDTRPITPAVWMPWALTTVAMALYLVWNWLKFGAYADTGVAQALRMLIPSLIVLALGGAAFLAVIIRSHRDGQISGQTP
jgi:MFS superfamily sulfate permease-like transporter